MLKQNAVHIIGGAQTDFERNWSKEGKGVLALLKEVIDDGLRATGIGPDEISSLNKKNRVACFVGNFCAEKYVDQGHLGALLTLVHPAFNGVPSARYEAACASSSVAIDAAMTKIVAGEYDVCIVVGWELMKTVDSKTGGDFLGFASYYEREGKGVEYPFPQLFGRLADNLLEKYHYDEDRFMSALALIADKNYANAKRNHYAQTRNWYMSLQQANNRGTSTNPFVGGRLASSDCSQVTDGAAVVILVSDSYAKSCGLQDSPVIKGYGHRVAPMLFDDKMAEAKQSRYALPWTKVAVEDALRRANMVIDDIDFFETHDCFTTSEFAAISAFGLAEPGDELEGIESGRYAFNGEKPINPSGGLIGCGHPVGATGARMLLDLYKQVSGTAGTYQLQKAETGMMLNLGGSATTNYVYIVGRND